MTLSDRQREAIGKLTQLSVIKALREQQGVEKPKAKKEASETSSSELDVLQNRVEKANRELKVADNEHERTKSDASIEDERKIVLDDDFYNQLAMDESSNNYNAYNSQGGGIGAIGKYQMRKPAFQETGFMDKNGNFTGKDGINSVSDFLNNPKVQEKAIRELLKKNYNYMINYKVLHLLGNTLSGKIADFPITISGMLAASHKEGGPMTAKYLKSLEKNKDGLYYLPYHKYKGNTLRSFLAIETRLREFSALNTNN